MWYSMSTHGQMRIYVVSCLDIRINVVSPYYVCADVVQCAALYVYLTIDD